MEIDPEFEKLLDAYLAVLMDPVEPTDLTEALRQVGQRYQALQRYVSDLQHQRQLLAAALFVPSD